MTAKRWVCLLALAVFVGGCRRGEATAPAAPDAAPTPVAAAPTTADAATTIIPLDLSTIEPVGSTKLAVTCVASEAVPGGYRCTSAGGGLFDPCFVVNGPDLACSIDPKMQRGTYVTATEPLPPPLPGEPVAWAIWFDATRPTCLLRTNEPLTVGGEPVSYTCQAPGAWVVDGLDVSEPLWRARYVVTDSSGATVTTPPEELPVAEAWVVP